MIFLVIIVENNIFVTKSFNMKTAALDYVNNEQFYLLQR